jgi:hypothetical protein
MAELRDVLGRLSGVAALYLFGVSAAHGQFLYGCVRPTGMPPVPDGSTATLADMQATREAVEAFLSDGEAYVSCLADVPEDPTVSAIRNQFIAQMDLVVERFNVTLCAYSRGTQCVQTATVDPSTTESVEEQSTVFVPGMRASDPYDLGEARDEYAQNDTAGPAVIGLENAADVGLLESERASIQGSVLPQQPGGQIKDPTLDEPTLPDGTPCGSVTQIRNDVNGDGFSLRGHYVWDVYNACFEPIRVRWTFAGDGLLNSQRSIPARGAQRIGCSTRGGTVSSRYCTGGVEYAFEWPGADRPF